MMIPRFESLFQREAILVEKILSYHPRKAVFWTKRTTRQPIYQEELATGLEKTLYFKSQIVAVFLFNLEKSVRQNSTIDQTFAQLCATYGIDQSPDNLDIVNVLIRSV